MPRRNKFKEISMINKIHSKQFKFNRTYPLSMYSSCIGYVLFTSYKNDLKQNGVM